MSFGNHSRLSKKRDLPNILRSVLDVSGSLLWKHLVTLALQKALHQTYKKNSNGQPDKTVQIEISNEQIRMIDKVSDSSVRISEITLVLTERKFPSINVHVLFVYYGKHKSSLLKIEPLQQFPKMKVSR